MTTARIMALDRLCRADNQKLWIKHRPSGDHEIQTNVAVALADRGLARIHWRGPGQPISFVEILQAGRVEWAKHRTWGILRDQLDGTVPNCDMAEEV